MSEKELTPSQQAEIDSASRIALKQAPADDVRQWLQDVHSATLSTLSLSEGIEGFPACSVVPFALDEDGLPFILIARIAAHTRNLLSDNRASLFIRQGRESGDPQSQWRATLTGFMERLIVEGSKGSQAPAEHEVVISAEQFDGLKARYRERVPKSDTYFATHDFGFWRMRQVKKVRYIAGFGRICWFNGAHLIKGTPADLASVSDGAIEHMNADHVDALELLCKVHHNLTPQNVRMVSLDGRGFFMKHTGTPELLYTSFGKEIDAEGLRHAFVKLTRDARRRVSED
jgi:hypothetical protein